MSGANARLTSEPFAVSHRNGRRPSSQRKPARTSPQIVAGGRGGGEGKRIVAATVAAIRNDTPSAANANGMPDDIQAGRTDAPPKSAGGGSHFLQLWRTKKTIDSERQILDAIHFGRGATLEQKIAVRRFLPGNRIDDEQWSAKRKGLGSRETTGLADDEIGHRHHLVHVGDEAKHVRRVTTIVRRQFAP